MTKFFQLVRKKFTLKDLYLKTPGIRDSLHQSSKAASERSVKVVVVERATREESYRSKTVFGLDARRTKIVSIYAQKIHIGGKLEASIVPC